MWFVLSIEFEKFSVGDFISRVSDNVRNFDVFELFIFRMFQKLNLVGSDQNNNRSIHLIHITNEPIDAIDLIRRKSESGHENDEPIYLCDISDVIQKHVAWKRYMPRVIPFYG